MPEPTENQTPSQAVVETQKSTDQIEKQIEGQILDILKGDGEASKNADTNKEPSKPEKPEESNSESKNKKIDEIFDDLLEEVKNHPEAKKVALETLIKGMKQTAEDMKQVRDQQQLHEKKLLMMKFWKELNAEAGGDSELLNKIQEWGTNFNEQKVIYHERIDEVKDKLIDNATEIQNGWTDMQPDLGKILGIINRYNKIADVGIRDLIYPTTVDRTTDVDGNDKFKLNRNSGLDKFIASLSKLDTGFDGNDIDIESATDFKNNFDKAVDEINRIIYERSLTGESPIEGNPELANFVNDLIEKKKTLNEKIDSAVKNFKLTKTISDTVFLEVNNQQ